MVYLLETDISSVKSIYIAIRKIYGIGKKNSLSICKKLGFSRNFKTYNLSSKQISKFLSVIENSNISINSELKKKILYF